MNIHLSKPLLILLPLVLLAGCSGGMKSVFEEQDGAPDRHVDLASIGNAVPQDEPRSRYGNPDSYVVFGKRYHVMDSAVGYRQRGIASWYGSKFHGRRTSSGEAYDMYAMTAAHKSLPLPTYVEVTNLENGRRIIVKVNDRGPFHQNRLIDLSYVAAAKLGITRKGTGLVEVRALHANDPGGIQPPANTLATMPQPEHKPGLFIQAGAFRNRDNALRLQTRLSTTLGQPVRIFTANSSAGPLYRVQVGPLAAVDLADSVSMQLEQIGISHLKTVID